MTTELKKGMGLLDTFCMAAGFMIASTLFVLPGIAFEASGPAAIVSYALAAVLLVPCVLSQAELATAMPRAGGTYFYVERSLGALAGTLAGLANWFSISLKSAFALVGIGAFTLLVHPNATLLQVKIVAIGFCAFFTIINLLSIRSASKTQVALVLVLLLALAVYIAVGIGQIEPAAFADFMPRGLGPVLGTAGMVFVGFIGLTEIANVAEEIRNPRRNIPLGMFLAFLVVSLVYVLAVAVTIGVVAPDRLAGSLLPISLGAEVLMGRAGIVLLAIAALLAFVTTANAGILCASRSLLAMSRDGLLPSPFRKVSERGATPYFSILFTSAFMVFATSFLSIENLVKAAATMMLVLLSLVNLAVIVMREGRVKNYRPSFRAPCYPWLQIAAIGLNALMIFEMGLFPIIETGVFGLFGLAWFGLYCRRRKKRQSGLVHLAERVTSKRLVDGSLEDELESINQEKRVARKG